MLGPKLALSDELNQAITKEIQKMKRGVEQNKEKLINDTLEFRHIFKAQTAKVDKE
jgi:hypothetical protein